MAGKKYYAVAVGRNPGIYTQWFGDAGAHVQVKGVKGARYKGFATIEEARAFLRDRRSDGKTRTGRSQKSGRRPTSGRPPVPEVSLEGRIVIYTDGSSLGNPGPGGYGVVIPSSGANREFSGGFRQTTNNRMELLACIVGLEQLPSPASVAIYSDSRYVVDGITKGWARKWQQNGWRKSTGDKALNIDLWERLLVLCARHDVAFIWVKGHSGNPGNERCDQLANQAAAQPDLPSDIEYEKASCPDSGKPD